MNLPYERFKSICRTRSTFLELKTLKREIIFADEKSLCEDKLYSFPIRLFAYEKFGRLTQNTCVRISAVFAIIYFTIPIILNRVYAQ